LERYLIEVACDEKQNTTILLAYFISVNNFGWVQSNRWKPLLSDFIVVAGKLEKLGFRYFRGKVSIVDPEDY
jgi:hypothetical protein